VPVRRDHVASVIVNVVNMSNVNVSNKEHRHKNNPKNRRGDDAEQNIHTLF
jgi:hypothetical protein